MATIGTATALKEEIRANASQARSRSGAVIGKNHLDQLKQKISVALQDQNAVLVAHYYVDPLLQDLAEETGGFVGDSLEMASFGYEHKASTVVVAGVRFMGETSKILSPEKRVLVIEKDAECSLDLGCPADEFAAFCDQHPDRTVVVYANTSAAVKARAHWVVTSSIALKLAAHLHAKGEKILWAPDKYLGSYVQQRTGADMLLWDGACIVHEEFKGDLLDDLKQKYPQAAVLVHPESPASMIALADVVGSTSQLIHAARTRVEDTFIVATEQGIFHRMESEAPGKKFLSAPTGGDGATCESCAQCPWMKMNGMKRLLRTLNTGDNEIMIDEEIRSQAEHSLKRMVEFGRENATIVAA